VRQKFWAHQQLAQVDAAKGLPPGKLCLVRNLTQPIKEAQSLAQLFAAQVKLVLYEHVPDNDGWYLATVALAKGGPAATILPPEFLDR
jgi:hypothetical protein